MRVLFVSSPFGTPRHRCQHPREGLAHLGVDADVTRADDGDLLARVAGFTHVVLNRVPFDGPVARAVAGLKAAGTKVLWDVDDLIFDPALLEGLSWVRARAEADRQTLLRAAARIREGMEACGAGLCATPALVREAEGLGRPSLVPNCVSDELVALSLRAAEARAADAPPTIGYASGHPGLAFSFALVKPALRALLGRHPTLRVRIVGFTPEHGRGLEDFAGRIDAVPLVDWRCLPGELARFDVCLAPLVADRFHAAKSDLKYLESALVRVPLVATRIGQLAETITDGVNGRLAGSDEEWIEALDGLLADPARRAALAAAAREDVLAHRRTPAMGRAVLRALAEA